MAAHIQREVAIPTGAVGGIVSAKWAEKILQENRASLVLIGRALLNDSNWPLHAAFELDAKEHFPPPYDMWIGKKENGKFGWRESTLSHHNQSQLEQSDCSKL